jgi:hypothetical protein
MNTVHRTTRFWWILLLTAIAVLFPTAGAHASPAQAAARSQQGGVSPSVLMQAHFAGLASRPATAARISANANPATYTDPASDSGTAPDITSVVVSNDANKQITLRINVAKLVVPSDNRVLIAIDSDQNAATGSQGTDYLLLADLSDKAFGLAYWNGSSFAEASSGTASASYDDTSFTFSINSSDLGNTTGFNFWARTLQGDTVAAGNHDDAPDSGSSNYQLGPAAALKLTVQLFHASKARAGKPFVAVITVARSDGALADVTLDDVTCTATIGGRPLQHGGAVALGPAVGCSWRLPKRSRGKTLRATVTVNLDGATVTKTFTARIK